ncbi:MAG: radical SAM protein [Elusimicrobiota bacterium]
MAKVVFVQDSLFEYQGIEALSAFLKSKGHSVSLMVLSEAGAKNISSEITKSAPDVLAFSVTSYNYEWALELSISVKEKLKVLSVFGGAHPTCFPEFIRAEGVDVICRGEGEEAFAELCGAMDKQEDIGGILNLWVKDASGAVRRNGLRPLIEDLDSMPFYDREIYFAQYPLLRDLSNKRFLVQRGCPYSCSFCFNHSFREMYDGLGKFVRFRSPANIVAEIERVRSLYPLKTVSFNADSFTLHPDFFTLMTLYKARVGLPFFSNARFNELDEKKIIAMKDAGCNYLAIGVESGNERLRNEILHRNMSDEIIIENAGLLKKHGIPFNSYVMLGLPTETMAEAFQTLQFLSKIGSDTIMPSIYKPLIGTGLWSYMKDHDLFEGAATAVDSYAAADGVKLPDKRAIFNLYKLSHVAVRLR